MVYLVEAYRSRSSDESERLVRQVRALAASRAVRLRGRIAVRADEIDLWLFDAASGDELASALALVGLAGSRVSPVEALDLFAVDDETEERGSAPGGLRPSA